MKFIHILFILLALFLTQSCKQKPQEENPNVDTYFSVKQFLDDQWVNREGIPFTLRKITTFNGITDSSFIGLDSTVWQQIREKFDPTDISKPEFLDQYFYSNYDEDALDLTILHYEAKDKNLFTQKMDVNVDMFNNRVRSIYIETRKKNAIYIKTEKLLYAPDQIIQIQQFEKSIVSPIKEMKVVYLFD